MSTRGGSRETVVVSATGAELAGLARRATGNGSAGNRVAENQEGHERRIIGVVGAPGAGKSTFASALTRAVGVGAVGLPMDGYHLADAELERLGLRSRKGAPETFDAYGYAALLARVRAREPHIVYAPGFERVLEQPIAGALPIGPEPDVVITEGNYLLLDGPGWRRARSLMDEVWFVVTGEELRQRRLVERHIRFGKSPEAARRWVAEVDQPNAAQVAACQDRADLVVDLRRWES
ncbi:nucleoside/nucleotide kinase family protein [Phytoactinopolyspora alkaliphila]|uniref:Nucleoside/nucleotide kinase family protein n=1 Tax=Phytoactinopolyspora alkaliphila TaxID=1783498 RepID=A0A6N9YPI4_9ACTN|nr:nucleoside/nucleotide kinase family protein [Phytoactinopolyspora alkaliphila]NED96913.1 nucleoside/nucleotide kinase family protein [Phytoactinopolyspora alkaliphila]